MIRISVSPCPNETNTVISRRRAKVRKKLSKFFQFIMSGIAILAMNAGAIIAEFEEQEHS